MSVKRSLILVCLFGLFLGVGCGGPEPAATLAPAEQKKIEDAMGKYQKKK